MEAVEYNRRFGVAGTVGFAETEEGLVKAAVSHRGMTGEIVLQGAQVTGWRPAASRPVIFVSDRANFAPGKAIRGGIPVIFPWFGPHPSDPKAPQHGFVRTAPWRLDAVEVADAVTVALTLEVEGFALGFRARFGAELEVALTVRSTAGRAVGFEAALHSYFAVSDVTRVSVTGLEETPFIDKTANMERRQPARAPLVFAKETDSVYLGAPDRLAIDDPLWGRRIAIAKTGAASAIVWNPWSEKAAAMADLGSDNWRRFVCVETGNVADNRITLAPGAAHEMTTRIRSDAA